MLNYCPSAFGGMEIRLEHTTDKDEIFALTTAAFKDMPFSDQREAAIVDALREHEALTLSLVALEEDTIVGHVAFSPVAIEGQYVDWYALGPVSVWPERQGRGIGQSLIREGLERLRNSGAKGCVLVGDPNYYSRFGFENDPRLTYSPVPAQYLQRLVFVPPVPQGEVQFHPAFG